MSGKNNKKLRQEVQKAGGAIFDEIRRQINAMPLKERARYAVRILRGRW